MIISLVAHRGDCQRNIENTLSSIKYALDRGINLIEIDVQLSQDNVPVLFHDRDLSRLTQTKCPLPVLPLKHIKKLKLQAQNEKSQSCNVSEQIATLPEVIALISTYPEATLFIEIKRVNFLFFSYQHVLKIINKTIKPIINQCVIISFSYRFIRLTRKYSSAPIGFVLPNWSAYSKKMLKKLSPEYIFTDSKLIPASFFSTQQTLNTPVWVIYEISSVQQLKSYYKRGFRYFESFTPTKLNQEISSVIKTDILNND